MTTFTLSNVPLTALPAPRGGRDPHVAASRLALSSSSTLYKFPQTLSRSGHCCGCALCVLVPHVTLHD